MTDWKKDTPIPAGLRLAADQDATMTGAYPPFENLIEQLREPSAALTALAEELLEQDFLDGIWTGQAWMRQKTTTGAVAHLSAEEIRETQGDCLPREWLIDTRVAFYIGAHLERLSDTELVAWQAVRAEVPDGPRGRDNAALYLVPLYGRENAVGLVRLYDKMEAVIRDLKEDGHDLLKDYRHSLEHLVWAGEWVDEAKVQDDKDSRPVRLRPRPADSGNGVTAPQLERLVSSLAFDRLSMVREDGSNQVGVQWQQRIRNEADRGGSQIRLATQFICNGRGWHSQDLMQPHCRHRGEMWCLLAERGFFVDEIAAAFNVDPKTVNRAIRRHS
jgi:hypothetical protein